jgi:dephospho-CoA kinase
MMLNVKWITKTRESRLYQVPVPIVGLTGGIASGKSTVAKFFQLKDVPVIDADKLVKNIYKKTETIDFIKNNFSEVIENNSINFSSLRELVFTQPDIKKRIEDCIYTQLPEEFIKEFKSFPQSPFIVYDVPLLFEKGLEHFIDTSICVYSPRKVQLERLIKRDNIDQLLAQKILEQQINIEEKKDKANLVIDNSGTFEQIHKEFNKIFSELTN